ncbi:DNA ligase-associated DEXH box helicase [Marivirga tractuosa]|uniref:Metallo-beta-lactamase n=1 Tax=Marivirga tractuosa (strain ATCC 23168 / DSM 4126 / NBRC 15989 / NCIMB 1408 / VKM B-1430 / H-43) TaxID=643867 RepID=E4TVL3_MARTH|nr:ligase-associated DNA damage response exonuclease [Marivirga tractuosa]ADR21126.1 metallo-beta-lactamase [Marivirga tractuosa DSM 4126]BDD14419.1 DNA ligase-associated DEXH box helicase [Marivirga tractuosa]
MHSLLKFTDNGIYCPEGEFYIDPWRPVKKALITHAHADHSRPGHQHYLAHLHSETIMRQRLGVNIQIETINYDESININGVKVSFHPAGHIPGSAQIRIEYKGKIAVVSGDYKLEDDGLSTPFESINCHEFVTETTFGLPIYQWKPQSETFNEINHWWKKNKADGKTSVIFAYALGKAQRIMKNVDTNIGKIYTHGAVESATEALRKTGLDLPETTKITNDIPKKEYQGNLVIATPASIGTTWMKKLAPYSTGIASGWMMLRGTRRRKAADRGFVLSDHADWNGLLEAVKLSEAETIYSTHGYSNVFTKYLQEQGLNAISLDTQFEGESLDSEL